MHALRIDVGLFCEPEKRSRGKGVTLPFILGVDSHDESTAKWQKKGMRKPMRVTKVRGVVRSQSKEQQNVKTLNITTMHIPRPIFKTTMNSLRMHH